MGDLEGEAVTAQELIAALPRDVDHRVVRRTDAGAAVEDSPAADRADMVGRAHEWHRVREGLRSPTFLSHRPPEGLGYPAELKISGMAGEAAHGFYYPADIAQISELPPRERADRLRASVLQRAVSPRGLSPLARDAALDEVRRMLDVGEAIGLDDARLLDFLYLAERLRNRSGLNDWAGLAAPLLNPTFQRAAIELTTPQRLSNALHRAVTARLVPQWADIPYFSRSRGEVQPARQARLGAARDRERIDAIVALPDSWADGFDVPFIQRAWTRLRSGSAQPGFEVLLQRVIWRATFADYVADLNGEATFEGTRSGGGLDRSPRSGWNVVARAGRRFARWTRPR
jgi:hypothetical protein